VNTRGSSVSSSDWLASKKGWLANMKVTSENRMDSWVSKISHVGNTTGLLGSKSG